MLLNYINNYKKIIETINKYKIINNRDIRLIVVSKTQDYKKVIELEKLGQRDFGENYLDEAVDKINQIDNPNIIWHYIGAIQSNKIKSLSENFNWIHTVASEKHAKKINNVCENLNKVMNVCIQINIDNEDTKGGVSLDEYDALSLIVRNMKNMKLKGIMAIPKVNQSCIESFSRMREIYNRCDYLDTLSMGMSKDYISAIEYNANMLRIGQQIFGKRT
jgi:pyridoxal phosphate enzyme (YggS family)